MHQRRRWQKALGVFALLLACLVLWLRTEQAGEWVCGQLRERLPGAVDAEVVLGRCEIDPLILSVRVHDVRVTQHGAAEPMVVAQEARVALRGLFFGGVSLQEVALIRPRIDLVVPKSGDAASTQKTCPLELLSRIRIASVEVQDGSLQLKLPSGQLVKADGVQVQASLTRGGAEVAVSVRGGSFELDAKHEFTVGRLSLEGSLDPSSQQFNLRRSELNVEGVNASVTGSLVSLCDPLPHMALNAQVYLPMVALPRFGVKLDGLAGQAWARLSLTGRVDAPLVRAEVQASQVTIGQFTPGDFQARLAWSGHEVKIEEFLTKAGEGDIRVSGDLTLTPGLPIRAKIETREASFGHVMDRAGIKGAWVEFPASLKASISGKLVPVPSLSGDVEFHTGRFSLASRAYDAPATSGSRILGFSQSSGTFKLSVDESAVAFNDAQVKVGPQSHTVVNGSVKIFYDQAKGLDIRVNAPNVDLSDFGEIAELPFSGFGSAQVTVLGSGPTVVIDGQTTLHDFKLSGYSLGVAQSAVHYANDTLSFPGIAAQKGRTQYFGDVELEFRRAGLYTRAAVQLPNGRVEDVIDLLADLSPSIQNVQGPVLGGVSLVATIDSPAKELTGIIAAQFHDVTYDDRKLGAGSAILRFDHGDALVLEPMQLRGPVGTVAIDGTWQFAGPLDYRASLTGGSLQELLDPSLALPVIGEVAARVTVGGNTDVITVDGTLETDDIRFRGRSLGPSNLTLKLVGSDLAIGGTVFTGLTTKTSILIHDDWPTSATFNIDLDDATAFLPESAELALTLKGLVTANGPLKKIDQAHAVATLESVTLARGDVSASNVEPIELGWNAGAIEVHSLAMKGATTEFHAEGSWGPSTVDLRTTGSIDLRLLTSFVTDIERTQGRLDFTAGFAGPVKSPTLIGSADLVDVRLSVKGEDLAIRSLQGHADFSESRILLQDVQGFLNDGKLRARGDIRIEKLALKSLEVQADFEDVAMQVQPDVPATFTGGLVLASKGGNGLYQLSGALDVVKFRYAQPLSLDTLLANARNRAVLADEKPTEWVRFDIDVATGKDVRIENNLARARLLGKVKLSGTNVKPTLIGAVEVGEGAQAFFRGNTFSVGRGVLQFNGLWPTFDLSAQSQVRGYLVNVKAFGRLDDPKISLTAEPALSEADVLSLLTLGVTTRERFDGTSGAGLAAEALFSASGLDQQVQKFLSRNVGLKDQQVRFTTSFNEATGTAEPSVTWESKVISDNFKIGVTQPVTGRGTQAQAEYRFNPRVSARAQWDNQTQNTSVGNPGVNLRFRFEWE